MKAPSSPDLMSDVARLTLTMHGSPYSLATTAPGHKHITSNLVSSRRSEIDHLHVYIVLKFGKRLGSGAAEPFAKFQSNMHIRMPNLAAPRLRWILW